MHFLKAEPNAGAVLDERLQEKMWIEIINRMESLYATLANRQAELEEKNRELIKTKEFMENVIKHMAAALIVTDSAENITMVNQAALSILGYTSIEIIGEPISIIFNRTNGEEHGKGITNLKMLLKNDVIKAVEIAFYSKTGERIPMMLTGSLMRDVQDEVSAIVCVARDIRDTKQMLVEKALAAAERAKAEELKRAYDELQKLEEQLIQSEKMASVGQLAAGIAHEINNPLTSVLTSAHFILKNVRGGDPNREDAEIIVRETQRCREIIRSLLDFARQSRPRKISTDINSLLRETLAIMDNQLGIANISLDTQFCENIPHLMLDVNQIQQVFVNLILNAIEAMQNGGSLSVRTDFDEDNVYVLFKDTGCGIPEENIGKIFDPFFTTKSSQKGTGLGLSVSYGIIQKHNGTIEVKSKIDEGSVFTIKLSRESQNE